MILNNKSTGATNDYKKVIQLINKVISSGISELGIINKEKLPENILYQEEKISGEKLKKLMKNENAKVNI